MLRKQWLPAVLLLAAVSALMSVFLGCEEEPAAMSDLDQYFAAHPYVSDPRIEGAPTLHISPTGATVSTVGQVVAFRAYGGDAPYDWGVASETAGSVRRSEVNTESAVYTVSAVARNTVIVSDITGRSAVADLTPADSTVLQLVPQSVTLFRPSDGTTVQFLATGGTPPYGPWQVAFPNLGSVDQNGLYTVASATVEGSNLVTVADSAGAVATATVNQQRSIPDLSVVPSTATLVTNNETAFFIASGGVQPYDWTVTSPSHGRVLSVSGDTTVMVYQRISSGDNTIVVRDSSSLTASFTVSQPAPTPPVITPATATLETNQTSIAFAVSGGTPSYVWSVVSGHGTVSPTIGTQTVYTRNAGDPSGNYIIRVTDSSGLSSLGTIIQR